MTPFLSLLLPIVLASVAVFIVSMIIHMVMPWHKSDYGNVPNDDPKVSSTARQKAAVFIRFLPLSVRQLSPEKRPKISITLRLRQATAQAPMSAPDRISLPLSDLRWLESPSLLGSESSRRGSRCRARRPSRELVIAPVGGRL